MIKIKQYFFKTKKSYNISEFDAFMIKDSTESFVSPKKYDYLRTNNFVIYNNNKRSRTKSNLKIRRALAAIAKETNDLVRYNEKLGLAFTKDNVYVFADIVHTEYELDYHMNKFGGLKNPIVVSLTKSDIAPYIELDNKPIYEHYKNSFVFQDWFRKFLKMRALRAFSSMGFNFNSRRYNDTKWTAEDKFRHDFVKRNLDIYKVYFTLARVLDSKLDACGKGFPISGLMYFVLDVDGKCSGDHLINKEGICLKCLNDSNTKLEKTIEKLRNLAGINIIKILFSGTKGWHIHLEVDGKREVSEQYLRSVIKEVNDGGQLVDWFDGKEIDGVRQFDTYRIFKVPNTCDATTACLVSEGITRLKVEDKIVGKEQLVLM